MGQQVPVVVPPLFKDPDPRGPSGRQVVSGEGCRGAGTVLGEGSGSDSGHLDGGGAGHLGDQPTAKCRLEGHQSAVADLQADGVAGQAGTQADSEAGRRFSPPRCAGGQHGPRRLVGEPVSQQVGHILGPGHATVPEDLVGPLAAELLPVDHRVDGQRGPSADLGGQAGRRSQQLSGLGQAVWLAQNHHLTAIAGTLRAGHLAGRPDSRPVEGSPVVQYLEHPVHLFWSSSVQPFAGPVYLQHPDRPHRGRAAVSSPRAVAQGGGPNHRDEVPVHGGPGSRFLDLARLTEPLGAGDHGREVDLDSDPLVVVF